MPTGRAELAVGLVPQGGADWIAGIVYLENIVRAVLARSDDRLALRFIAGPGQQFDRGTILILDVPTSFYTHGLGSSMAESGMEPRNSAACPRASKIWPGGSGSACCFRCNPRRGKDYRCPGSDGFPTFNTSDGRSFSRWASAQSVIRFQRLVDEAPHVIVSSQDAQADLMRWFPHRMHASASSSFERYSIRSGSTSIRGR